jgi:hypothetical protein
MRIATAFPFRFFVLVGVPIKIVVIDAAVSGWCTLSSEIYPLFVFHYEKETNSLTSIK